MKQTVYYADESPVTPIPATYDYRLVALSILIAIFASYAALDLAARVTANRGRGRLAWLMGGAFALGSGICAMHYTGMLAYRLPMPVYYDIPTVALSLFAADLAALIALYVVSRERMTALHVGAGSLLMGAGIATMHYTGMAAMRLPAMHHYRHGLWILSIFLAIGISQVGLLLIFYFRGENRSWTPKAVIAVVMGLAIPAMHYTGMAAVRFTASAQAPNLSRSVSISVLAISSILLVTFVILGFAVITSLVDRRLSAAHTAHGLGANSVEQLLTETDFDLFPEELAAALYADEKEAMDSGKSLHHHREEKPIASVSNEIYILGVEAPLHDNGGRITGISGVGRELSERKKNEEALRRAHQQAEVFINAVPSILIGVDQDSQITRWNSAAASAFGLSGTEVLGKRLADCGIRWRRPDMSDEIQSWCSERGSRRCDLVPFEMKGETRLLGLTITAVSVSDGDSAELLVIGSDVTERKKGEDALLEAERKYRGIFDDAIVGMFQSTPDGRFLSVNRTMARIFGFQSPEEMIASVTDISQQLYVDPKRYREFVMVIDRLGSMLSLECEVFRKDGSRIWITSSGRAVYRDGAVIRYEGMTEDVTERRLLRSQLLQAQKLESIGQLAAGIAHEINTPTQYIGDNVRFLKDAFQDIKKLLGNYDRLLTAAKDNTLSCETVQEVTAAVERADVGYLFEEIPKAVEQAAEGVTRVSTIVSAMKEFSHPDTKEKILLDLNHAIKSTITVARSEWKYIADMETDFDPTLPPIRCQPGEFNQVILNLIVNAAHAIADVVGKNGAGRGTIKVQTRNCQEWAEIRIQDTGSGIPEKVQPRIFDPFFTTKEIGKGTGQGLAIARSVVVDKHNGTIHFETEEGKGTTFIVRLPHEAVALATTGASA